MGEAITWAVALSYCVTVVCWTVLAYCKWDQQR
jgi:hypothetical protein